LNTSSPDPDLTASKPPGVALGTKQMIVTHWLSPHDDIADVRFVPKADSCTAAKIL